MIWPPQNTGIFEYKTPCCDCPVVVDCCYYEGTGSGAYCSGSGTISTYAADLGVITSVDGSALALSLTGTLALIFAAGAEVVLTFSGDGLTCGASITGLTPDSETDTTRTYTIPADDCYIIGLTADTGPGTWSSLSASVAVASDLAIDCESLEDRGFVAEGGGGP
jgi:hypothetical protein